MSRSTSSRHLKTLRRVAIGLFTADGAARLEQLETASLPEASRRSAAGALGWLPRRRLTREECESIRDGRPVPAGGEEAGGLPVALLDGERLLAIGRREADMLKPEKVFPHG